jgi:hypothetical protein
MTESSPVEAVRSSISLSGPCLAWRRCPVVGVSGQAAGSVGHLRRLSARRRHLPSRFRSVFGARVAVTCIAVTLEDGEAWCKLLGHHAELTLLWRRRLGHRDERRVAGPKGGPSFVPDGDLIAGCCAGAGFCFWCLAHEAVHAVYECPIYPRWFGHRHCSWSKSCLSLEHLVAHNDVKSTSARTTPRVANAFALKLEVAWSSAPSGSS